MSIRLRNRFDSDVNRVDRATASSIVTAGWDQAVIMTQAMDDLEQIRQLKARYFRFVDTQNWLGLNDVFADDVVIDMTGEGGGVTDNVAAFIAILRQKLEAVTTVHHGHMPEIEILSATEARGIWAMEDQLWWPDGSPLVHMHGYGHYHETYRKLGGGTVAGDIEAGGWVIASMTLTRLRRDLVFANPAVSG